MFILKIFINEVFNKDFQYLLGVLKLKWPIENIDKFILAKFVNLKF